MHIYRWWICYYIIIQITHTCIYIYIHHDTSHDVIMYFQIINMKVYIYMCVWYIYICTHTHQLPPAPAPCGLVPGNSEMFPACFPSVVGHSYGTWYIFVRTVVYQKWWFSIFQLLIFQKVYLSMVDEWRTKCNLLVKLLSFWTWMTWMVAKPVVLLRGSTDD